MNYEHSFIWIWNTLYTVIMSDCYFVLKCFSNHIKLAKYEVTQATKRNVSKLMMKYHRRRATKRSGKGKF